MTEPEIHTWWPKLTAAAKEALGETEGGIIPAHVRLEIERITGREVDPGRRITAAESDFIRTQGEMVD